MKLPLGCKYANFYSKPIVEEEDTKEIPAQYRERYENDSHELLGASDARISGLWKTRPLTAHRSPARIPNIAVTTRRFRTAHTGARISAGRERIRTDGGISLSTECRSAGRQTADQ